jgi:predicted Zn-dependent protease
LGVRYLSRAGYDPEAMASFLKHLEAHSRLQAELAGRSADTADVFDIMQTHPRTLDRIQRAIREAGVKKVADPMRPRDVYLSKLDGAVYGDAASQGFVRGRRFVHPTLKFAFTVPQGFHLSNTPDAVSARDPDGALILFDSASDTKSWTMTGYLRDEWAPNLSLHDVEAIDVNGMKAATGRARVNTRDGVRDFRLVAIRFDERTVYRMLFVTKPDRTGAMSRAFRETTYSFKRLSAAEAAAAKPYRIALHRVRKGETAESLARRTPFKERAVERFRVLNGLPAGSEPEVGRTVKLVVE